MDMTDWKTLAKQYLTCLREILPDSVEINIEHGDHFSIPGTFTDLACSGVIKFVHKEHSYQVYFEMWNSYLAQATISQQIERAKRWIPGTHNSDFFMIFARYLPLPAAQRLLDAGVNFIDLAGNIHLQLGLDFEKTIVGKKEQKGIGRQDRFSAAHAQMLFTLSAYPHQVSHSIRKLEALTGISKSHVSNILQSFIHRGLIYRATTGLKLAGKEEIEREMVQSYDLVLRSNLLMGRYRSPHKSPAILLESMQKYFGGLTSVQWSLTGGIGADRLQGYYSGLEKVFFFDANALHAVSALKFVPDRNGDITILRGFGAICYWKDWQGIRVAHPWLVYAELLTSSDLRAQDAAQNFRREFIEHDPFFSQPA